MRMLAATFLAFLSGCCLVGRSGSLPAVWVVPELKVRLKWEAAADDPLVPRVQQLCHSMNEALYDALDGQVYIAKFTIYRASQLDERSPGTANLHLAGTRCETCHPHAYAGRPDSPAWFHTALHAAASDLRVQTGIMVHEFLHAFTGVLDEYREVDAAKSAECPGSHALRITTDACIMFSAQSRTELCRPSNHEARTHQGQERGMSCYEWVEKVVREARIAQIVIPDEHFIGPKDPPRAEIDIRL